MEARLKRSVSVDEVRSEPSLSNSAYAKLLKETQPVTFVPIDVPTENDVHSGGNSSLADTISDPTELDASEITEHKDKVALLREEIKKLPDPQKKILLLYYYEELKLSEIAQIFGLTEGRISQILSHSVLALRSHFQSIL
jgi:RNA polymerase sigma factor for flagellar operon FliA